MAFKLTSLLFLVALSVLKAEDDLEDFQFSEPEEVLIAQESRQYQTFVKPPVRIIRPNGVTNSHRPQYNLDSLEEDLEDFLGPTTKRTILNYKSTNKLRAKESMIKEAVLRALERKDHVGKFAQIYPIIRAMSGQQRVALASLVASQVSTPPGRSPLNLAQVRSMFGNNNTTSSDLMLPILLDMANLIRRAVRSGKEPREVREPLLLPQPQILRRSFDEDTYLDDEPFDIGVETTKAPTTKAPRRRIWPQRHTPTNNTSKTSNPIENKTSKPIQNETSKPIEKEVKDINIDKHEQDRHKVQKEEEEDDYDDDDDNDTPTQTTTEALLKNDTSDNIVEDDKNKTKSLFTTPAPANKAKTNSSKSDNGTLDLAADATNQTAAQDLPVAEKLRAFNRFIDRKGSQFRRGIYPPKPSSSITRRTTAEPTLNPISSIARRRPIPSRKLPSPEQGNCELFTNTLCLHSEDYPTEAIVQSIRRNKAAAGALLADFKDPGEGALDGVTAAQEAKYTASANRRGDTSNRADFQTAGEAGFMCPSTVKYARPQRARATSGQWKYIVNTGEHTQTLRLEKCLKPKEPCTYLTDNFKSKCVQVYNYHRLLTWDQQNGLHMDIFKVPTCCSCHIEGYSVSFPPLGHRVHETSNENFPGEDLSPEHGNGAFEQVQSSVHRPSKTPSFIHKKPLESFPPFADNHNLISGSPFQSPKLSDNDELINPNLPLSNPIDSYGNAYFPDSFNQASSIRAVKRPPSRNPSPQSNFDQVTLPSYLEPPTPSASSTFYTKESSKYKLNGNQFKRGIRPNRRPIRKKIGGPEDLAPSGTSAVENLETLEDFNDELEEPEVVKPTVNIPPSRRGTIAPKLHAVTTENSSTMSTTQDQKSGRENHSGNGKRVNYNYHPIIDFFDEGSKDENGSIDREDSEPEFIPPSESEWKPINNPPARTIQSTNLLGRRKHK